MSTGFRERLANYHFEIFKEPRGAIRIVQVVFAVLTCMVLKSFDGYIDIDYCSPSNIQSVHIPFEYPFDLNGILVSVTCNGTVSETISLMYNFVCEAEFVYQMCWIATLFPIFISFIYVIFWEDYESNGNLALIDFWASVAIAVMWISAVGSWGYGQYQLKHFTHPDWLREHLNACKHINCLSIVRSSMAGLTQSLILTCLNFFLWAAGLWFLYKETPWYSQLQQRQG